MAIVKKPKWKKATGSEGAISVKGGAYPVRGTGVGGGKVRGEVSSSARKVDKLTDGRWKKVNGVWEKKATAASPLGKKQRIQRAIEASKKKEKIANLKKRVGVIKTDVNNLAIRQKKVLAERRKLIDMKNVVKAKTPSKIVDSAKVAAIGAGLVTAGYAIPKKKKSSVVKKKKSPVVKKKLRMDKIGKPSQWIK